MSTVSVDRVVEALPALRGMLGWNQRDLAARCGCCYSLISRVEKRYTPLCGELRGRVASAFGMSTKQLEREAITLLRKRDTMLARANQREAA